MDPSVETSTERSIERSIESETSGDLYVDPDSSFYAWLHDGFCFKNLLDYLKGVHNASINFIISQDLIYSEFADENNIITNVIRLYPIEFLRYDFQSKTDKIVQSVNVDQFKKLTKKIIRKDTLLLMRRRGDPNLHITPNPTDIIPDMVGQSYIKNQAVELIEYGLPTFQRRTPNCCVLSSTFYKKFSNLSSLKYQNTIIKGYPNGIQIETSSPGDVAGLKEVLGRVETPTTRLVDDETGERKREKKLIVKNRPKAPAIKTNDSILKRLTKLHGVALNGVIKFYMEDNMFLKINSKISSYGEIDVYVKTLEKI